jgi:hypothetical protein
MSDSANRPGIAYRGIGEVFKTQMYWIVGFALFATASLQAASLSQGDLMPPYGVQPFIGLGVTTGMTTPFFSDLSGIGITTSTIVDVLANVQAFDSSGNPITTFSVSGVSVTQGTQSLAPSLGTFGVTTTTTYSDAANPSNQVMLQPSATNLAFMFNSDSSYQYTSVFNTIGIPDGGFLLFDTLEAPKTREPGSMFLAAFGLLFGFIVLTARRAVCKPRQLSSRIKFNRAS